MLDDCLMADTCPGYDRVLEACLVQPKDCGISPAAGEHPQSAPEAVDGEHSVDPIVSPGVAP